MAKRRIDPVADSSAYLRLREWRLATVVSCRQNVADGKGLNHWNLSHWLEASLDLAGTAFVLELGDGVVAGHFSDALEAARIWFDSGRPWRPTPQAADPKVTVKSAGGSTYEITEVPRRIAEAGWMEDWNIGSFEAAMLVFLAFGTRDDARRAGQTPDVAYRSPDVVADEASFAWLRAQKAWVLDRFDDARATCQEVLECPPPAVPRAMARGLMAGRPALHAKVRAMLALLDNEPESFRSASVDIEREHTRFYARLSGTALRFYCLPGLALARMAKRHGVEADETPLLPTRFLPGSL